MHWGLRCMYEHKVLGNLKDIVELVGLASLRICLTWQKEGQQNWKQIKHRVHYISVLFLCFLLLSCCSDCVSVSLFWTDLDRWQKNDREINRHTISDFRCWVTEQGGGGGMRDTLYSRSLVQILGKSIKHNYWLFF